jgi:NADH-quinone oxidoreductase subunit M
MMTDLILPALILIPFVGGLLCWLGERFGLGLPRWVALLSMLLVFLLSLQIWAEGRLHHARHWRGKPRNGNWNIRRPWIPALGISIPSGAGRPVAADDHADRPAGLYGRRLFLE